MPQCKSEIIYNAIGYIVTHRQSKFMEEGGDTGIAAVPKPNYVVVLSIMICGIQDFYHFFTSLHVLPAPPGNPPTHSKQHNIIEINRRKIERVLIIEREREK